MQWVCALSEVQFDMLIDSSSNPHSPELVTVTNEDLSVTQHLIGFDVWGMAQHFRAKFYRGDSSHPSHLPVPLGYWFLGNVGLAS